MRRWRWSNVPVPEAHVAALIVGGCLHLAFPVRLPLPRSTALAMGLPTIVGGIVLSAWAVGSAEDADVERGSELVTAGAYQVSRNPMYLGWSAAMLGIGAVARSPWLLACWLLAVRLLHREILAEEDRLTQRFGARYEEYRGRVARYLPRWRSTD
jgi:protein-S-isoprenylcysteine O-methyltransferase Ste14